jgi:hypothetical protein
MKNRLINGDMRIDQRNAGASGTATNAFAVDRWIYYGSQASKGTWGQNLNAVTPPVGFKNYLGFQSSSAYTVLTTDSFSLSQPIEGVNIQDLVWGTANAKTITISFQVYSSLTGTFGGAVKNGTATRSYPFSYTIPVANTWTTIALTIPGDTAGTWATDTTVGIYIHFGLGMGATYSGTAGAWVTGTNIMSATGAVSVVGTNAATLYVTGIQLEQAAVASPFERRFYVVELALCQRYYNGAVSATAYGYCSSGSQSILTPAPFPVTMRVTPTVTIISNGTFTSGWTTAVYTVSSVAFSFQVVANAAGHGGSIGAVATASAEL